MVDMYFSHFRRWKIHVKKLACLVCGQGPLCFIDDVLLLCAHMAEEVHKVSVVLTRKHNLNSHQDHDPVASECPISQHCHSEL